MSLSTEEKRAVSTRFYRKDLHHTTWEVPERYERLQPIGSGAFGNVCSAYDKVTNQKVAIKKLARPFQTNIHAERAYRELRLLRHMEHDNVIGLLNVFTPQSNPERLSDVYFVCHLMGADLSPIVKYQKLSNKHIQFLIYQILRGLKDLKPGNIGVNKDYELRILDFGHARQAQDEMTGYVVVRWYRAPEIMLNWMHYTQAVDIWSVGCIMAELITGTPIFPGDDHITQLNLILDLVGTPNEMLLSKIESEDARNYIASLQKPAKDFHQVFPQASEKAIDLMKKMLELDPDVRITAEQGLEHPYLEDYHDPTDEPICTEPFNHELEPLDYPIETWKNLVFQEIDKFQQATMWQLLNTLAVAVDKVNIS